MRFPAFAILLFLFLFVSKVYNRSLIFRRGGEMREGKETYTNGTEQPGIKLAAGILLTGVALDVARAEVPEGVGGVCSWGPCRGGGNGGGGSSSDGSSGNWGSSDWSWRWRWG